MTVFLLLYKERVTPSSLNYSIIESWNTKLAETSRNCATLKQSGRNRALLVMMPFRKMPRYRENLRNFYLINKPSQLSWDFIQFLTPGILDV